MSSSALKLLAASGAKGDPVYVDDLFSTFLYTGTGSNQEIVNGIDLAGEGGLVWLKVRDISYSHKLCDTERGVSKRLESDTNNAEYFQSGQFVGAFNDNGFQASGSESGVNQNNAEYCSWTFRKQPGFFDIVAYTGNGSARTISHNLDATVGMLIVKNLDVAGSWFVYHLGSQGVSGYDADELVFILDTDASRDNQPYWNNTAPTSSVFSVGSGLTNTNGQNYIAYLFAHDAQDFGTNSDEAIIKCGSYTGSGSSGLEVDVGFEPQWLLVKAADQTQDWFLFDMMRLFSDNSSNGGTFLRPNLPDAELALDSIAPTSSGFKVYSSHVRFNSNTSPYLYVAIRRPQKPASEFVATKLFNVSNGINTTGTGVPGFTTGFPVDMGIFRIPGSSGDFDIMSRLTGLRRTDTPSAGVEANKGNDAKMDYQNGWGYNASSYIGWAWRRAPGYFDVTAHTSNGQPTQQITHNLGVAPEMAWIKGRTLASADWFVYHKDLSAGKNCLLNTSGAETTSNTTTAATFTSTHWTPGDSGFESGGSNNASYIAYLFASVDGISKIGTYTGTGSDLNVDCGFSAGARFILIKRKDSTGDWYLYDSVQGIVAGNDPYLLLSSLAAQVTNTDYIDPLNAGFTVTSSAPAALNNSGGTYIFLAIA